MLALPHNFLFLVTGKVLFRSNVREVALKRKSALDEYCKVSFSHFAEVEATVYIR